VRPGYATCHFPWNHDTAQHYGQKLCFRLWRVDWIFYLLVKISRFVPLTQRRYISHSLFARIFTNFFLIIPVPKMKGLVYTKLVVFAISAIAMLAWCLTLAGGIGSVAKQPATVSGSTKAWLIARFVILGVNISTQGEVIAYTIP